MSEDVTCMVRAYIPQCGNCPPPHPYTHLKDDGDIFLVWECPECGMTYRERKTAPAIWLKG